MYNRLWRMVLWVITLLVLGAIIVSVKAAQGCPDYSHILVPPPPDNLDPTWVWGEQEDCGDFEVVITDGRVAAPSHQYVLYGNLDYLQIYRPSGELAGQITVETELPYCPASGICVYLLSTGEYQVNIIESDGKLVEIISDDLLFNHIEVRVHDVQSN